MANPFSYPNQNLMQTSRNPSTAGDISYRTAGYVSGELLKRGQPLIIVSRFGQNKPIPPNSGKIIKFRGYESLDNDPNVKALTEGVTPASSQIKFRDVEAKLEQFGDWVELTDVLSDTHEDPLWQEFTTILGEQSAIVLERVVISKLLAGTNVFYASSTATPQTIATVGRNTVDQPITLALQRQIIRALKKQLAQPITSVVNASPNFGTSAIPPSYVAICHTDLEADIRILPGFVPVEKYGAYKPMEGEIGSVEGVRYLTTTLLENFQEIDTTTGKMHDVSGGAIDPTKALMESADDQGTCCKVYPILFLGKDAFGVTPFAGQKGKGAPIMPMVLNPNTPRGGDPLGQRGSIGWKAYRTAVILYDPWMIRAEVAVRSVPLDRYEFKKP